jgi:hypothetical protein
MSYAAAGVAAPLSNPPPSRRWRGPVVAVLAIVAFVFAGNYLMVGRPVATALSADSRNAGFTLRARYAYFLDPRTLVLNLSAADAAAPIDLYRGVFQSAQALSKSGREFDKVILARNGTPRFQLEGSTFLELGREFGAGQNPVYLIRTFPEKLHKPDGTPAFGTWTGGLLGVLGRQMEDVNEAARQWATP